MPFKFSKRFYRATRKLLPRQWKGEGYIVILHTDTLLLLAILIIICVVFPTIIESDTIRGLYFAGLGIAACVYKKELVDIEKDNLVYYFKVS